MNFIRYLLFFPVCVIALCTCSDKHNDSKSKYAADKEAFIKSLETFGKANEEATKFIEDNKDKISNDPNFATTNIQNMLDKYKDGIKESEKVSDDFLDFLHPKLKSMYKDTFVDSFREMIEFSEDGDYSKAMEIDKKVNDMQKSFYSFLHDNQDEINKKIPSEKNAPKKSYWRMFLRFLISNFVSILVFSFFVFVLLLPLVPIVLLAEKINKGLLTILSIPFMIIAGVGQAYFWILWAAYCAFTIRFYMDSPAVSHNWLYYVTGFLSVTGPIGWLSNKEKQTATSYDEQKKNQGGTFYYSLIAIVAFIVFCIWTNLLDYKYISWVNDWFY